VVRVPLGVRENNIDNGGTKKKGVKIKARNQSYEVLANKQRFM
jgi:hypothetical protein